MRTFVSLAVMATLWACTTQSTTFDSKSNWLRRCTAQTQCGDELECSCGVCSKRCASSAVCGARAGNVAVCVRPSEQGLGASCQPKTTAAAPGICLQSCLESAQCGSQQQCSHGVCVSVPSTATASTTDAAAASHDAAVSDASGAAGSVRDAATIDASRIVAADAGDASKANVVAEAAVQTGQPAPTIEVDCRPRYGIVGTFGSRCQYIGADLPELVCPDLAVSAEGGLHVTVLHPERVRIGQPVVLDGSDPDVTIDTAFANTQILVQTYQGAPASGMLIFDDLRVGEILRGRFVGVQISALPDPPFKCAISDSSFVADWGPGVRDM